MWLWVAGAVVALALLAGAVFLGRSRSDQEQITSVAVLPFVNGTNDPNSEYLSDGITESLINNLSQIPNLVVRARASVFRYKGRDVDPQTIAKDLKVQALVTGRIMQRGDQLIVSSELTDARTSRNLWGDHYDRKLSDVLAVQQEITSAIAARLRERLTGEVKKQVAKGGTADPEAYQLYLKGRYQWEKRTPEALEKSKEYFNQAIEKDPGYATAYVGLASYYVAAPDYEPLQRAETVPKAIAAAQKALAIDDTMADAHAAIASASQDVWDWDRAEKEFKRALELDPNQVIAHQWYGLYLASTGRGDEALPHFKRALELDPLNLTANVNLATGYNNLRQYNLALKQFKQAIEIDPNYAGAHYNLGQTYQDMGEYELWLKEWKQAAVLSNDREEIPIAEEVARAYAKGGFHAALSRDIGLRKQEAQHTYVDPAFVGYEFALLGDKDQAFSWLEKAYAGKAGTLGYIKVVKAMDPYRSDPRYVDLVKRIGLPL
jgi:TolB-like protein/Tfp pilus assembly protein PilF